MRVPGAWFHPPRHAYRGGARRELVPTCHGKAGYCGHRCSGTRGPPSLAPPKKPPHTRTLSASCDSHGMAAGPPSPGPCSGNEHAPRPAWVAGRPSSHSAQQPHERTLPVPAVQSPPPACGARPRTACAAGRCEMESTDHSIDRPPSHP